MEDKVDGRDAKKVEVEGLLPTEAQRVQQKVNDDKAKQHVENERAKKNKRAAQLKLEERKKKEQKVQEEEKRSKERERLRKIEIKEMDEKQRNNFLKAEEEIRELGLQSSAIKEFEAEDGTIKVNNSKQNCIKNLTTEFETPQTVNTKSSTRNQTIQRKRENQEIFQDLFVSKQEARNQEEAKFRKEHNLKAMLKLRKINAQLKKEELEWKEQRREGDKAMLREWRRKKGEDSPEKQETSREEKELSRLINKHWSEFQYFRSAEIVDKFKYESLDSSQQYNCIPEGTDFKEYLTYAQKYLKTFINDPDTSIELKTPYTFLLVRYSNQNYYIL